jgi:hypothetical protein
MRVMAATAAIAASSAVRCVDRGIGSPRGHRSTARTL